MRTAEALQLYHNRHLMKESHDQNPPHLSKPFRIGVITKCGAPVDDPEKILRERIASRLAKNFSLVDVDLLERNESNDEVPFAAFLYFPSIGPNPQLYLDQLEEKPTVVVWRGNPPRKLPSRAACMNVCLGDPNALSRIVGFMDQLLSGTESHLGARVGHTKGRGGFGGVVKLAVDVRLFAFPELSERGIGHYVLPHLQAILSSGLPLEPSLLVDSTQILPESVAQLAREFHCRVVSLDVARDERFDIVHLPDPVTILPGYDSPLRSRPRSTITSALFYDLIPLRVRDQHFDRWDPLSRSVYLNRLAQVAAHDCHIFAISECTRRDLIEVLGIPPGRVTTILAGQNYTAQRHHTTLGRTVPAGITARYGIRSPFFLIVGAIEKHKNFPLALEAFSLVRENQLCQLVVVGSFTDPFKEVYRELCHQQGMNDVIFTGFLEKHELEQLYGTATAVLVPSLYEGFGFPALEAMEHESAVIASTAASIPEVVGDAGILLSPTDPIAWAHAMKRLIEYPEERDRFGSQAKNQARRFSWEKNASLVTSVWEDELARRRHHVNESGSN